MTLRRFPEGFLWGAATSAHQVEGGNTGNDWWRFEQEGHVAGGEVSGEAVDSYHRYEQDFDLAAGMDHSAHRLSLEWSRIEPARGEFDETAVEHYASVLRALEERGMKSFVTLNHFTVPQWFEAAGGWDAADAPAHFERYASAVAPRLEGLVDFWVTLNEPIHYVNQAYFMGTWPPRKKGFRHAYPAFANLARAHRRAYAVLKAGDSGVPVGIAVNSIRFKPCAGRTTWQDVVLTGPYRWLVDYWFLDKVRGAADFIGLQYYMAASMPQILRGRLADPCAEDAHSDLGWRIYPAGLRERVTDIGRRYRLPIYITENGIADADDDQRPAFIRDHLAQLHRAITEDGADVRGYLHWSLLDNFEWAEGWAPKFGLIEVDRSTMARRPRPSAAYYAGICRDNAVDDEADPADVIAEARAG